jgi:hypothetical protein
MACGMASLSRGLSGNMGLERNIAKNNYALLYYMVDIKG